MLNQTIGELEQYLHLRRYFTRYLQREDVCTLPAWFDHNLIELYQHKRNRHQMRKRDRVSDAFLRNTLKLVPKDLVNTHKHSWRDIEGLIDETCAKVKEEGFSPDRVIGIKSGGAFITNYIALCLGVESVDYMRVSHYSAKSQSIVQSFDQYKKEAKVTESFTLPVARKKILLVDDQCGTGASLEAAEKSLVAAGSGRVCTFCLFSYNPARTDYFHSPGMGVYFPWGTDA